MPIESKPITLGTLCPDFNLPSVDGKNYSKESFKNSKVLVVGFTCNHCPYVQAYEKRFNDLVRSYESKSVSFACINSNDEVKYPDDSFEHMKKRSQQLEFAFHYLRDESQKIAKSFNAACTPEFYIYDADRKLKYHGRIDDNQKDPDAVKFHYMKDAIDSLLNDKPIATAQTAAIGCGIKWKDS